MSKAIIFTARKFETATAAFVTACSAIDRTISDHGKALNAWAGMASAGIANGAITLDAIKAGIIARFPKAETIGACGDTIKGQYYALAAVIGADKGDRLINGEALNTVAREARAESKKTATGKNKRQSSKGKPKAAGDGIGWMDAVAALSNWLSTAKGNRELAVAMANDANFAAMLAKVGAMQATLAKPAKIAKPVNAARARKVA